MTDLLQLLIIWF